MPEFSEPVIFLILLFLLPDLLHVNRHFEISGFIFPKALVEDLPTNWSMHGAVDGPLFHEFDSLCSVVTRSLSLVLQIISDVVYFREMLWIVLLDTLIFCDAHLTFGRHKSSHHSESVLNFLFCQFLLSFELALCVFPSKILVLGYGQGSNSNMVFTG